MTEKLNESEIIPELISGLQKYSGDYQKEERLENVVPVSICLSPKARAKYYELQEKTGKRFGKDLFKMIESVILSIKK